MRENLEGKLRGAPAWLWRVPVSRRGRRGAVRGQGEVAALPCAQLLPARRHAVRVGAAGGADRRRRGHRHAHGGRGAAPRAEPRQAAPAAVQHQAPRRQVVPVHRGDADGRVPARDVHTRAAPSRDALLRPVREREEGARDARRAEPRVPLPPVRGPASGTALRDPVPRLPHRPLLRSLHRRDLEGRLRRRDRRRHRLPVGRHADDPGRARGAHARGRSRGALRGGGAVPKPPLLDPAPRGSPGRRSTRRGLRRRHRARDRWRPGRGAGLPAARREDDRPLRIPPRERRRRGRAVDSRGVRPRVLRRNAGRAARGADPAGDR